MAHELECRGGLNLYRRAYRRRVHIQKTTLAVSLQVSRVDDAGLITMLS